MHIIIDLSFRKTKNIYSGEELKAIVSFFMEQSGRLNKVIILGMMNKFIQVNK